MAAKLKPLNQQVIVITGASSGIGLATAETAVTRGAKVVLAARSESTLRQIAKELSPSGREAIAVGCDVIDREQVQILAEQAISAFGRIDTWVNDAGIGIYGWLKDSNLKDSHRLFEVNFWGVVNGSLVALPYLRAKGGALINVGSEVSEAATPLLGMYVASKHAVKGFTDALRIELEDVEQSPIAVTLIQPTACNTPFPAHALNCMETDPKLPEPMIDPQQVADAILDAAVSPTRSKKVGATAVLNTAVAKFLPSLGDQLAAKRVDQLQADTKTRKPHGAFYDSSEAMNLAGRRHPVAANT